jgi:hypothetical protein
MGISDMVVFVDTKTTGTDHAYHKLFEVAIIDGATGIPKLWWLPIDLNDASPAALRLNLYYQRLQQVQSGKYPGQVVTDETISDVAEDIAVRTAGKMIVGSRPWFDAQMLADFLREQRLRPAWHYHFVCVENLIAGNKKIPPPWNSNDLSRAIGVDPSQFNKNTAGGCARWVKAQYEAVYASTNTT